MEIYVIDQYKQTEPHFPIIGIIPAYHSMIWNIQLYGLGYFEVTVEASAQNVSLLQVGRFLCRQSDIEQIGTRTYYNNAMIIRRVATTYDAELGWLLTVSGKSTKDIATQRIIWDRYEAEDRPLTTVAVELFIRNITNPDGYITDIIDDLNDVIDDLYDQRDAKAQERDDAQEAYDDAVAEYGADSPEAAAAKETLDTIKEEYQEILEELVLKNREMTYWQWDLEAQEKRVIPYVIAGLIDYGFTPPRVTVQLQGENLGEWMEEICNEYHLGWQLSMSDASMVLAFDQGTDRTGTVIFSPEFDNLKNAQYVKSLEAFKNAGLVNGDEYDEGFGPSPVAADVGTASGQNRYEMHIDASSLEMEAASSYGDYYNMLLQYGKSEIIKYKKKTSISGEIDTDGVFKIGQDFNLGDVVTVQTEQKVTASTRLIEIIYADESSGSSTTGTFEEWED